MLRNGLNINKTPFDENGKYSIKFEIKFEKETKTIEMGRAE